jgi:sortase A
VRLQRRLSGLVAAALLAAGLWQLAAGLWIPAKAALAQRLLERAWTSRQQGAAEPRPWPWADTSPVGRLVVERLDVDLIVLAGSSGRTLAFAPGHVTGTALPGRQGHVVIAAHRDTHFAFLRDLRVGDHVTLLGPDGRRTAYRVEATTVVDASEARLVADVDLETLTLVTCWPFDAAVPGGPLRYLVSATGVR